jgi:hypothetical protein
MEEEGEGREREREIYTNTFHLSQNILIMLLIETFHK